MPEYRSRTTISQLISNAIAKELVDVHTCLPGRIESFDPSTGLAKVVPMLRRKYVDEDSAVELPVISGVPVLFYRAGDSWVKIPVAAGDYVLLVFSERSLDLWIERGGSIDPEDPAKFSLNDAVAYPGIYPKPAAMVPKCPSTSLEIVNGDSLIEITSGGRVNVTATKVVVTSSDINLGDESGSALALKSDLSALVITAPNGLCTINATACVGTTKVKGK